MVVEESEVLMSTRLEMPVLASWVRYVSLFYTLRATPADSHS